MFMHLLCQPTGAVERKYGPGVKIMRKMRPGVLIIRVWGENYMGLPVMPLFI